MLQAARNHCLDVMIVDENATAEDVAAARLLAQRGVTLVAAAPVSSLSVLPAVPELQPLLGVTGGLSPQRSGLAAFMSVLEMQRQARWRLHSDAEASADVLLSTATGTRQHKRSQQQQLCLNTQWRSWDKQGRMVVQFNTIAAAQAVVEVVEGLVALAASAGPPV